MKAVVAGAPAAPWRVEDVPVPAPGPNDVLISVRASGLCYTDVHLTNGFMGDRVFPARLGHEPVGEVAAVGAEVSARAVGDRVGVPILQGSCGRCEWCLRDKPLFCASMVLTGLTRHGGHADFMVASASATVLLPDSLTFEQAAPILCAGYTVWSGLRRASPQPGETVAVLGIGGLGHLAIQYAKAAGHRTVAITRTPDKRDLALGLGADEVVDDGEQLRAAGGADIILFAGNSFRSVDDALLGLRPDGRLMILGWSAEPLTISPMPLLMSRAQIRGSTQNTREHLYEALQIAAAGRVSVRTEVFDLADATAAYERVASGDVRFRAVLVP